MRGRLRRGVNALESEPLRAAELVKIDFLQIGFQQVVPSIRFMDIVLMGWIARPVAARSVDFHNDQAVTGEAWWDNTINLTRSIVSAANLNLDIVWCDQAGRVVLIGRSQHNGVL